VGIVWGLKLAKIHMRVGGVSMGAMFARIVSSLVAKRPTTRARVLSLTPLTMSVKS
jgi:cytochrome b561